MLESGRVSLTSRDTTCRSTLQISIIQHNCGAFTAKLHENRLQVFCCKLANDSANPITSYEFDLSDRLVCDQCFSDSRSILT
jgi:hypothetical protein